MSWDKVKLGYVCDRCGAEIWVQQRQAKFGDYLMKSDPSVTVSRNYFNDDKGVQFNSAFMYCFDCEPVVIQTLQLLNKVKS